MAAAVCPQRPVDREGVGAGDGVSEGDLQEPAGEEALKVFWISNAPFSPSGYGVQTALFGPRIAALGHDLAFFANWGVQGACLDWNGHRIYPSDSDWGNRTMAACAAHFGDGLDDVLVITLCDAWVLNRDNWPDELRVAMWAPVDHWPVPPAVRAVLADGRVTPVAMSRFGQHQMELAGLEPLYVPHGVDTAMFRPRPEIRADVRAEMGLPADAFVVGIVAANQGSPLMHRKAFPQMLQAFARFREQHTDAVLYVHSNEYAAGPGSGIHLRQLAQTCGIPRRSVMFTEAFAWELGWPRETLAQAYQAFDVLLHSSMGEGFGVPIVEAQSCGVPVIVTDHSAMTELCGAGWLVDGDDWYDGPQDSWFKAPSVASIVTALDRAYESAGDAALREQARAFALDYDADRITAGYWTPALEALAPPAVREVEPLVLA